MEKVKSPESKKVRLNFTEKRSKIRKSIQSLSSNSQSNSKFLQKSLQTSPVEHNLLKLQSLRKSTSSVSLQNRLDGLIYILQILLAPSNSVGIDIDIRSEYGTYPRLPSLGIIEFDVGVDLYADFISASLDVRHDDIASRFRDDILHPEHGIRCIIYGNPGKRLIILDNDYVDMYGIFEYICREDYFNVSSSELHGYAIDYQFIQQALNSMDSEHDKNIVKSVLTKFLTRDQIYSLGIKPDRAMKQSHRLSTIFEEISNATVAAEDMLTLRLKSKIDKAEENVKTVNEQLSNENNVNTLPEIRRLDLLAKKEILEENIIANKNLLDKADKISKQKFQQCVKRLTQQLNKDNRLKLRKSGAGAKPLMDSEDETFVANAIESKTSAHGRRHDTVMYLHHRVKSEDLLSIANYNLMKRGKKLIKSAKTVLLRARPRNVKSIEGKKHKVGFRDTKAGRILQVSDETRQRKLHVPQHDFGTPEVYQTPSSFRFMTWKTEEIDGDDKLIKHTDESHVIIRPKYYVGSSGCVWASDLMRLRYECPDLYETKQAGTFSKQLRSLYAMTRDSTFYYIDSTTDEDMKSVVQRKSDMKFRQYEGQRLSHLSKRLTFVKIELDKSDAYIAEIYDRICNVIEIVSKAEGHLEKVEMDLFEESSRQLIGNCRELIARLDMENLPPVKPIIAEYTDAGPGVGISNLAVKFRFAEMCRIHNTSRRVRIHRASGDSAQNEAERTNSSIGDALVDGATLSWDIFKAFEGLSDEQIKNLTSAETDNLKAKTLERNAWAVAEQVRLRVDDAKGPAGGYLHAYVTERPDDQFFWNGLYLKQYCDASKARKTEIPGHGYFSKMFDFISMHIEAGELYMEYRRHVCSLSGNVCDYCLSSYTGTNDIVKQVPRPYPDITKLPNFHYLPYNLTPLEVEGSKRPIDDYQPRANLKKLFSNDNISSQNQAAVSEFSTKFIVPEEKVDNFIRHLETLKLEREKRMLTAQQKRQDVAERSYEEIDWIEMFENNTIEKQTVGTLDKYMEYHKLGVFHYKADKVQAVKRHIATTLALETEKSDDEDDLVIRADESSDSSDDNCDSTSDNDSSENSSSESESGNEKDFNNLPSSRRRTVKIPDKFKDYYM